MSTFSVGNTTLKKAIPGKITLLLHTLKVLMVSVGVLRLSQLCYQLKTKIKIESSLCHLEDLQVAAMIKK